MMIDNYNIALHRPPAHFGDKAAIPLAALLPGAGFCACIQFVPNDACFWDRGEFRTISSFAGFFPSRDDSEMIALLQAIQNWVCGKVVYLLSTQIIIAPLHVTHAQFAFAIRKKGLLEKGNVFVKELLLQVFRAG